MKTRLDEDKLIGIDTFLEVCCKLGLWRRTTDQEAYELAFKRFKQL